MHTIYHCHHCKRTTEPMGGEMRFCPYCSKYLDNDRQFCRLCQSESTPNRREADTCISCGETGSLVPGVGYTRLNVSEMQKMLGLCTIILTIYLWEKRYPAWLTTLFNWLGDWYRQLMMSRPKRLCKKWCVTAQKGFCLRFLVCGRHNWLS
jgi:hypothetical protein